MMIIRTYRDQCWWWQWRQWPRCLQDICSYIAICPFVLFGISLGFPQLLHGFSFSHCFYGFHTFIFVFYMLTVTFPFLHCFAWFYICCCDLWHNILVTSDHCHILLATVIIGFIIVIVIFHHYSTCSFTIPYSYHSLAHLRLALFP